MSLIAEFRLRSPGLVLEETLEAVPQVDLTIVREVATNPDRPYLFVWVAGVDLDSFEGAVEGDGTVDTTERYMSIDKKAFYRMRVSEQTDSVLYPQWVELGADLLEARHIDGWWRIRMRFPDREALSALKDWCLSEDISFELDSVFTDGPGIMTTELTEPQWEVLELGYREGYFEVPRDASMEDIAAELDISAQAVSERLRRGHRTLIAQHVVDTDST